MTTARTEQTDERAVFFHWITGADGLDHAVLEPELTLASSVGASVGYPALCRYSVIPDVHLSRPQRCCADCVNKLPFNALRRGSTAPSLLSVWSADSADSADVGAA
jgi:hypothetical protein